MSSAILLFSGGQDSTTCLYWAKRHFDKVYAIGFDYGQKHKIELEQASKIAALANVDFDVIAVSNVFTGSSLLNGGDHNQASVINRDLPASFVAGRNLLFLSIAGSVAANRGAQDIVTGVCQTDFSGYPDCRRSTIDAMQLSLTLGLGIGDLRIHTPLMYLTKAETWKMAKDLGCFDIVVDYSLTDYNGSQQKNEWGYGVMDNPATVLRAKGYYEAKQNGWL
jgi:7-cyano-7-deazaguanine synthase